MVETGFFILGIIIGFVNLALLVDYTGKMLNVDKRNSFKFPMIVSYLLRFLFAGLFLYSAVSCSDISLIAGLTGYLIPVLITLIYPLKVVANIKKAFVKG